jgi:hypothetical protein
VKVFAKAIHCLAKIGDELYVEALPKGVSGTYIVPIEEDLVFAWVGLNIYIY